MRSICSAIILMSVLGSLNAEDFQKCGRTKKNNETDKAAAGEFPHMCSLYRLHNGYNVFIGGASLVSPNKVVTLASAVKDYKVSSSNCGEDIRPKYDLSVLCGSINLQVHNETGKQNRTVTGILIHPEFNEKSLTNDVAVLIVEQNFQYTENVGAVCLPLPGENVESGTLCVATGHGKDGGGYFTNFLKKVFLPIWKNENCEKSLNENFFQQKHSITWKIHDSFLCAGGEDSEDTCEGDGGGPLVCYSRVLQPELDSGIEADLAIFGSIKETESKAVSGNDADQAIFGNSNKPASSDADQAIFGSDADQDIFGNSNKPASSDADQDIFGSDADQDIFGSDADQAIFGNSNNPDSKSASESSGFQTDQAVINADLFNLRSSDDESYPDRMIQYGVTAWGVGCAIPDIPSIYSSLSSPSIRCWLDQVLSCYQDSAEASEIGSYGGLSEDQCSSWLLADGACGCFQKLKKTRIQSVQQEVDYNVDLRGIDLRTVDEYDNNEY